MPKIKKYPTTKWYQEKKLREEKEKISKALKETFICGDKGDVCL